MTGSSWENMAPVITVINISPARRAGPCSQHFPHILSLNLYNEPTRSYSFDPPFYRWGNQVSDGESGDLYEIAQ